MNNMSAASRTSAVRVANSSCATTVTIPAQDSFPGVRSSSKITESAVYAHIRALRALGHTTINTAKIADALSLNRRQVERAISALKDKGIRAMK